MPFGRIMSTLEGWGCGSEPNQTNAVLLSFHTHVASAVNLFYRTYRKSGRLNRAYLRFLWMYREMDPPGTPVRLTDPEFESIVSTMARLLVMYTARGADNLVVPARLPEYGDE